MESAAKPSAGLQVASTESPRRADPALWKGAMAAAEHHARYWWAAQAVAGLRVLDAGCGDGSGAEILARAGAEEVVGVDIAPESVSAAMRRYGSAATFTLGDLTALPFDSESFDVAVSFEAIEQAEPRMALEELRRVLRRDGVVLVVTANRSVSADTNPHQLTGSELSDELRRLFGHVRVLQQSNWFLSAVMEQSDARSADVSESLAVELRKEAGLPADREPFAVAMASDATLPDLRLGVGVACAPGGPEEQFRQHVLLQHELEQACTREKALRREHDLLGERLWQATEGSQVELARAAADLERARRSVVAMQDSLSWRLTRPLRGFGGLLRRRS